MKIEWNKVTWYSKLAAVVLFVGVAVGAFWFGRWYEGFFSQNDYLPKTTDPFEFFPDNPDNKDKVVLSEEEKRIVTLFKARAAKVSCRGSNALIFIDNDFVRWNRQTPCPDARFSEQLFKRNALDQPVCSREDSIAGVGTYCRDERYRLIFENLGEGHTVRVVSLD